MPPCAVSETTAPVSGTSCTCAWSGGRKRRSGRPIARGAVSSAFSPVSSRTAGPRAGNDRDDACPRLGHADVPLPTRAESRASVSPKRFGSRSGLSKSRSCWLSGVAPPWPGGRRSGVLELQSFEMRRKDAEEHLRLGRGRGDGEGALVGSAVLESSVASSARRRDGVPQPQRELIEETAQDEKQRLDRLNLVLEIERLEKFLGRAASEAGAPAARGALPERTHSGPSRSATRLWADWLVVQRG